MISTFEAREEAVAACTALYTCALPVQVKTRWGQQCACWRTKPASLACFCKQLCPCFLACSGQDEVEAAVRMLEDEARKLRRSNLKLRMQPAPLYAGLPAAHQLGVFEPAPRGYRKVRIWY